MLSFSIDVTVYQIRTALTWKRWSLSLRTDHSLQLFVCSAMRYLVHIYATSVLLLSMQCTAYYNYFLKPHSSQSHGSAEILNGQEGVAYCAVNPEDGVEIDYTVCAYHGAETDLDFVASPFIANGSSNCCLCGQCGEGVLGPGVTAINELSPPNSNNFSVPACQVRSKTALDGSFVCLAHRVTEGQSSAKQALTLFHFQTQSASAMSTAPQCLAIWVPIISAIAGVVFGAFLTPLLALLVYCIYRLRRKKREYPTNELQTTHEYGRGDKQTG